MSQVLSESVPDTIAISKGSGLLNEMKALLRAWTPGEPLKEFSERVVQEDVLGDLPGEIWSRVNDRLGRNQGGQGHAQETVYA